MADLLLDENASKYFYDRTFYVDPATGKPRGFMGLKFFENNDTPFYNFTTLKKVAEEPSLPPRIIRQVLSSMLRTHTITWTA